MTKERIPERTMWVVNQKTLQHYGAEDLVITDEKIIKWCQAFFYGGNTLRLWNEATELKMALLTACSLQKGQSVLLISKYASESGIEQAMSSIIGQEGELILIEIGHKAIESFNNIGASPGDRIRWDFDYFDSLPDESLDRVILFGSSSHVSDWEECAKKVHRVLRDGGRVIIADAPWGGKELLTAAHLDTHTEGILDKLLSAMNLKEEDLSFTGTEELTDVFKPLLSCIRSFSWCGIYLFYGQKGGKEESLSFEFPLSTGAVQAFLTEKPCNTPWDFLANDEIDVLGSEIADINKQKHWARVIGWGGDLAGLRSDSVIKPMWSNLKAEPGFKVLIIGEGLERAYIPELKRRIGEDGEIAAFDMNPKHQITMETLWKYGPDADIAERHQWDYPFADDYPDEYFDLVWLAQGVHHARDWKDIAPRLARVLKPNHQLMAIENRSGPEFYYALGMSGLMKCMAEKIWWGWNLTFEELPDYPVAVLMEAFGDLLYDTYSLEWKGWLLFWGYKK